MSQLHSWIQKTCSKVRQKREKLRAKASFASNNNMNKMKRTVMSFLRYWDVPRLQAKSIKADLVSADDDGSTN